MSHDNSPNPKKEINSSWNMSAIRIVDFESVKCQPDIAFRVLKKGYLYKTKDQSNFGIWVFKVRDSLKREK